MRCQQGGTADDVRSSKLKMKTSRLLCAALVAFALASVVVGGCSSNSGEGGDCMGGVFMLGRLYDAERFNDGVFDPADLGQVVGVVDRTVACPSRDGEAGDFPVGTEFRSVPGIDSGVGIAAEVDGVVRFLRSFNPPQELDIDRLLLLDDAVEIGLSSDYDGSTRWATIDDPDRITAILAAVRNAPVVESSFDDAGRRSLQTVYFEVVRSDGLRSRTTYTLDSRLLSDRRLQQSGWTARELTGEAAAIIDAALDAAPPATPRDGLELVGTSGTADVLDRTACRWDRPQLLAATGERLVIGGPRSAGISFAIISGPNIEAYSVEHDAISEGIPLPAATGPVLIELVSMNLGASFCSVIDLAGTR
jgi:hypothetical protein